jgi:predicted aspartyl protease
MRRRSTLAWLAGATLAPGARRRAGAAPAASTPLWRLHTGDLGALIGVDATLGGEPWHCLIDSGATQSLVAPALAERLGLRERSRQRVATAGGELILRRVAMPPVTLGGQAVALDEALVLDLTQALGPAGAALQGLLGAALLRDRVTRLDLAAGRADWAAAWPGGAQPARAVWPLRWDAGLPVVDLSLAGRPPAPFLLDTGNAGALVVFARYAEALGVQRLPSVTLRELGGEVTVHPALVDRVEAPGFRARQVPVVFEAGERARRGAHFDRLAGSLGTALFGAGEITLDGPGGRLALALPGLPEPPPLPGGFGLALAGDGQVSAVYADGPAARAGVTPGAQLLALDGVPVGGIEAVWRALAGTDEARFRFDGGVGERTLRRERFFPPWP